MERVHRRGRSLPSGFGKALPLCAAAAVGLWLSAAQASPTPQPTPTATPTTTPAASPAEATATPSPSPAATRPPKPDPTATATPLPAADLAVLFLNNFCREGEPLLVSVYNLTSAPVEGRLLRLRLSWAGGLLEETDRRISLPPLGSANLPLAAPARGPWVAVQTWLVDDGPQDPDPANNAVVCQVGGSDATAAAADPAPSAAAAGAADSGPPAAGPRRASGAQAASQPVAATPAPEPSRAPAAAAPAPRAAANNTPRPALTPIGDAGGGVAPARQGAFPNRTLLMAGVMVLAAGSSWAFYYLTRPERA